MSAEACLASQPTHQIYSPNLPPERPPALVVYPSSSFWCPETPREGSSPRWLESVHQTLKGDRNQPGVGGKKIIPTPAGQAVGRPGAVIRRGASAEACLPQPGHAVLQDAEVIRHIIELRFGCRSEAMHGVPHARHPLRRFSFESVQRPGRP